MEPAERLLLATLRSQQGEVQALQAALAESAARVAARCAAAEGRVSSVETSLLPSWREGMDAWLRGVEAEGARKRAEELRAQEARVRKAVLLRAEGRAEELRRKLKELEGRLRELENDSLRENMARLGSSVLAHMWNGLLVVALFVIFLGRPLLRGCRWCRRHVAPHAGPLAGCCGDWWTRGRRSSDPVAASSAGSGAGGGGSGHGHSLAAVATGGAGAAAAGPATGPSRLLACPRCLLCCKASQRARPADGAAAAAAPAGEGSDEETDGAHAAGPHLDPRRRQLATAAAAAAAAARRGQQQHYDDDAGAGGSDDDGGSDTRSAGAAADGRRGDEPWRRRGPGGGEGEGGDAGVRGGVDRWGDRPGLRQRRLREQQQQMLLQQQQGMGQWPGLDPLAAGMRLGMQQQPGPYRGPAYASDSLQSADARAWLQAMGGLPPTDPAQAAHLQYMHAPQLLPRAAAADAASHASSGAPDDVCDAGAGMTPGSAFDAAAAGAAAAGGGGGGGAGQARPPGAPGQRIRAPAAGDTPASSAPSGAASGRSQAGNALGSALSPGGAAGTPMSHSSQFQLQQQQRSGGGDGSLRNEGDGAGAAGRGQGARNGRRDGGSRDPAAYRDTEGDLSPPLQQPQQQREAGAAAPPPPPPRVGRRVPPAEAGDAAAAAAVADVPAPQRLPHGASHSSGLSLPAGALSPASSAPRGTAAPGYASAGVEGAAAGAGSSEAAQTGGVGRPGRRVTEHAIGLSAGDASDGVSAPRDRVPLSPAKSAASSAAVSRGGQSAAAGSSSSSASSRPLPLSQRPASGQSGAGRTSGPGSLADAGSVGPHTGGPHMFGSPFGSPVHMLQGRPGGPGGAGGSGLMVMVMGPHGPMPVPAEAVGRMHPAASMPPMMMHGHMPGASLGGRPMLMQPLPPGMQLVHGGPSGPRPGFPLMQPRPMPMGAYAPPMGPQYGGPMPGGGAGGGGGPPRR